MGGENGEICVQSAWNPQPALSGVHADYDCEASPGKHLRWLGRRAVAAYCLLCEMHNAQVAKSGVSIGK